MEFEALDFINKAIEKTKSKQLTWFPFALNTHIKPLPGEDSSLIKNAIDNLWGEGSYYAKYGNGEILLYVYNKYSLLSAPPDGCCLALRMQDDRSKYSIEITNSEFNREHAILLARLYNLIDKDTSSIDSLIDDFLHS